MPPRIVIIDTQSLLDWLAFRNPVCAGWNQRLSNSSWMWVFTIDMQSEFEHVLGRGFGPRWDLSGVAGQAPWSRCGHLRPAAPSCAGPGGLRCTDPDDQKFLDLAVAEQPCHLVSRDKALLRLARRARERHAVQICTPVQWNAQASG